MNTCPSCGEEIQNEEKSKRLQITSIVIGVLVGLSFLGGTDDNSKLKYGDSGFPKNCRAIIKTNIDGYNNGEYKANEALDSINRNCGEYGYSWSK